MSSDTRLDDIRRKIDGLDKKLIRLISDRAALAAEIAGIKKSAGGDAGYYRPEREAQVLARVIAENPGPLSDEEIARLFRELMSACLALEQVLKIAFLGPEGTFTHDAALKHFGRSIEAVPMPAIDQVFHQVQSGACHYGVVPIENSIEGAVTHTIAFPEVPQRWQRVFTTAKEVMARVRPRSWLMGRKKTVKPN